MATAAVGRGRAIKFIFGVIMGEAKRRKARDPDFGKPLLKADAVWARSGLPFDGPRSAYMNCFREQTDIGLKILDAWEYTFDPTKEQFLIFHSNHPELDMDVVQALNGRISFQESAKDYALSAHAVENFASFIRDPSILRRCRLSPPTIVVWYDGCQYGNFVSQLSASLHPSRALIEKGLIAEIVDINTGNTKWSR